MESKIDVSAIKAPPRAHHNCTVVSVDTVNNLAEVRLPGSEGQIQVVELLGTSDIAINDVVRIWTSPDRNTAWLDGESPNVAGQAAKVSALYNPALTSAVASTDASGFLNIQNLFASGTRHNIQQLESDTPAATHDFTHTQLGVGLNGVDSIGCFFIAVAHKVGGSSETGVLCGLYLKSFGAVAAVTEIAQIKGSGVTTFAASASSNSLRISTDSDLSVRLTAIAMGGSA